MDDARPGRVAGPGVARLGAPRLEEAALALRRRRRVQPQHVPRVHRERAHHGETDQRAPRRARRASLRPVAALPWPGPRLARAAHAFLWWAASKWPSRLPHLHLYHCCNSLSQCGEAAIIFSTTSMVTGFRDPEEQAGGASTRLLRFHAVCDALLFSAVAAGLESRFVSQANERRQPAAVQRRAYRAVRITHCIGVMTAADRDHA